MKIRLAVIGDPIGHSLSPIIHTTVLRELGDEYEYEKVRVEKGGLEEFINYAKERIFCGFNVTMPHKVDIIRYLDEIDEDAKRYNSVNTVRIKNGRLYGFNTDGRGYIRALKDKNFFCGGKRAVILGAGGAASTVALKLAAEGAESITVLNRTAEAAQRLAENIKMQTGKTVRTDALLTEKISEYCGGCDILINGTPLGMQGVDADFTDFSFMDNLKKGALVSDLIYNPPMTSFLKNAAERGFETVNGLGMLIYQGLIADEIFLEKELDFHDLQKKIKNCIEKMKK